MSNSGLGPPLEAVSDGLDTAVAEAPPTAQSVFHVCTIAARNYLPRVRVLAASCARHHPRLRFTTLLVDDEDGQLADAREPFRCWRLGRIGLDRDEIGRLAGYYDATELCTAIKPRFLRALIEESGAPALYLDPDIKVFDTLDVAFHYARDGRIVLTPHSTAPYPRDGRFVDEFQILAAGVFNLGFVAVGPARLDFLDWWWQRTRRGALIDPPRMLFTDQRWIDFVPGLFDHVILTDPGYNVAYWNLHARQVTWTGSEYQVNDRPLRFFHFSGFDPARPHLLSKHQLDRPRILLSEHPAVARLCREYVEDLHRATGIRPAPAYGWDHLSGGTPFDRRMRALYRESLADAEHKEREEPPSPFHVTGPGRFLDWLRQPVGDGHPKWVSRYLFRIYGERGDVRQAYSDLREPGHAAAFLSWILHFGANEERIPPELLPGPEALDSDRRAIASDGCLPQGLNLVGYFQTQSGVGEVGRLVQATANVANIPVKLIHADPRMMPPGSIDGDGDTAMYDINLLCVNADQTPHVATRLGRSFFQGRQTVGVWFWEVASVPQSALAAFDLVDEVWVVTEHVASTLRSPARKPVNIIRLPLVKPVVPQDIRRSAFGLPDGLLFLFMFDFNSVFERKNPLAIIEAFARAFAPGEGPTLVIKSINGGTKLVELERLRAAASARPDVVIIDEVYGADGRNALLALCDCYVSLHRAEGWGLTMAEAMSLGKPVIATAYSGNLDFMTPDNALLVDYRLEPVPPGCEPYPEGTPWAAPSVVHAAQLMRRVYDDPEWAHSVGTRAARDIETDHSVEACAHALAIRLADVRQRASRRDVSQGAGATPAASGDLGARTTVDSLVESKVGEIAAALRASEARVSDVLSALTARIRHLESKGRTS